MRTLVMLTALALAGCDEAPSRPQVVLIVDADVPTAGQAANDPDLSADAAVDTVRIDVLDLDGSTAAPPREFVVPDPADWPVSFGVALAEGQSVLVRIWGYRAALSAPTTVGEVEVGEPIAEAAIIRVVRLNGPAEGVERLRVVLRGDCIGTLPRFGAMPATCVDGAHLQGALEEGIEPAPEVPASVVGTWPAAVAEPCDPGGAADDRRCIAGGFTRLGDAVAGLLSFGFLEATPLRAVRVSPFYLDATEVTVGEYRAIARAIAAEPPLLATEGPGCTWLGASDSTHDDLPLNCVPFDTAAAMCAELGGSLPTEAQWEHAARGRGQGRAFPWGPGVPDCCSANVGLSLLDSAAFCGEGWVVPAGTSTGGPGCTVGPDVSRDDVLDLGGSVSELTRDAARPYDHPCWQSAGVPLDPECIDPSAARHTTRGGNWGSSPLFALAAARGYNLGPSVIGFRCAYEDAP